MLSLVNYGSSGESDDEDNADNELKSTDPPKNIVTSKNKIENLEFDDEEWGRGVTVNSSANGSLPPNVQPDDKQTDKYDTDDKQTDKYDTDDKQTDKYDIDGKSSDILGKLPPPISDLQSIPWDQLNKLTYKSRAIRIMAPSIPEEIEEKKEKKVPSKTGSGLLAMLPKPKNEFVAKPSSLKPASLTAKKPTQTPTKNKLDKPKLNIPVKKTEDQASDSDGETDGNIDFFSLSAPELPEVNINDIQLPISAPPNVAVPTSNIPLPSESQHFHIDTDRQPEKQNGPASQSSSHDFLSFEQQKEENMQLDSEALAALCGSRGLKRRGANDDEFKIIDINGSELTPDSHELLTKNLTTEQPRPKRNNKDGPTSQQKRKHQIIYLAHQAKEQELELQNTWSNNRMSKKQTQAKYGF